MVDPNLQLRRYIAANLPITPLGPSGTHEESGNVLKMYKRFQLTGLLGSKQLTFYEFSEAAKSYKDKQRHERHTRMAEMFLEAHPQITIYDKELLPKKVTSFFERQKWDAKQHLNKALTEVQSLLKPTSVRKLNTMPTTSGLSHRSGSSRMHADEQTRLKIRCEKQTWPGLIEASFKSLGRGKRLTITTFEFNNSYTTKMFMISVLQES